MTNRSRPKTANGLVIYINQPRNDSLSGIGVDQLANACFNLVEPALFILLQKCGTIGNDDLVCVVSHSPTPGEIVQTRFVTAPSAADPQRARRSGFLQFRIALVKRKPK